MEKQLVNYSNTYYLHISSHNLLLEEARKNTGEATDYLLSSRVSVSSGKLDNIH